MGGTLSHKRQAVLLYLQGHLTSSVARQIQHAPEDVDRCLYDFQRIVELMEESQSVHRISFMLYQLALERHCRQGKNDVGDPLGAKQWKGVKR